MATFQVTGPDGKKYRVTGDSPEGAMQALRKMVDAPPIARGQGHAGVPEFVPPGVENYDPETGMVVRNSKTNSALWGAANMAGFGFGDELSAAVIHGIEKLPGRSGKSYDEVLGDLRRMEEGAKNDNPKSFLAGQVGGAVAQAVATRGTGFLPNAQALLPRVIGGAMTGGTYGALHGAGSGEGAEDRLWQALKEGGIGAAAGAAWPAIAQGASSTYSKVMEALNGRSAAKQAGTSPETLRMLGGVMEADGTRGPAGVANMARAGQDAMLADAGPNARAVLDTAIQRGGPGAVQAQNAVTARSSRAAQDATGALDNAMGKPGESLSRELIVYGDKTNPLSLLYKKAYATPIDYAHPAAREIEAMVRTRVPQSAINAANELMRVEGQASKQILAKVGDDGSVVFETLPDVRQLDYITRGLNEVADQADGMGKLGGTTARGRAYANLSRELRDNLKELVPEYKTALGRAATEIQKKKAADFGVKLLSPSTTRDDVVDFVGRLEPPERAALTQSIRSRIDDVMANVTRTVQDGDVPAREAIKALRDLSSRASREKIAAAIGEEQAAPMFAELDRAATSFDLRAAVADNSKTFARQATDRRIGEITKPGAVGTLAQGKPINAGQRVVQALTGQTPERLAKRQDAIYSELARVLTMPAGQAQTAMQAIGRLGTQDQSTRLMSDRIARALGGTQLSYPTTTLANNRLQQRQGR